jgi:hypothetical protein
MLMGLAKHSLKRKTTGFKNKNLPDEQSFDRQISF